jgi:hypothetical protein
MGARLRMTIGRELRELPAVLLRDASLTRASAASTTAQHGAWAPPVGGNTPCAGRCDRHPSLTAFRVTAGLNRAHE